MKRTRPGPAQNVLKQRAMKVLKQKKMFVASLKLIVIKVVGMKINVIN